MTAREINLLNERCRTRRRNLKRYIQTQSFTRLAGRSSAPGPSPAALGRARAWLAATAAGLLGTGLFFVIF